MQQDLQAIGYTKKAHGTQGALRIFVEDEYWEDILQCTIVFLDIDGKALPFFVKSVNFDQNYILFEDIDTREKAIPFTGKSMSLRTQDLIPADQRVQAVSALEYAYLKGFEMIDVQVGMIGKINTIEAFPQQEMAFVNYQNKTVMIPLNPFIIQEVNTQTQIVRVELPEGLLDL